MCDGFWTLGYGLCNGKIRMCDGYWTTIETIPLHDVSKLNVFRTNIASNKTNHTKG